MTIEQEIDKGIIEAIFLNMKIDELEKLQKRIVKAKEMGQDPATLRKELAELKAKIVN